MFALKRNGLWVSLIPGGALRCIISLSTNQRSPAFYEGVFQEVRDVAAVANLSFRSGCKQLRVLWDLCPTSLRACTKYEMRILWPRALDILQ